LGALAAVAAAGCSTDATRTSSATQTRILISQGTLPTLASAALGFAADVAVGPPGAIDPAKVDSLTVTVDSVQVLPDSLLALRHAGEPWGPPGADSIVKRLGGGPLGPGGPPGPGFGGRAHFPFGPGGMRDSLRERDSTMLRDTLAWGKLDEDWYTLEISGNRHLDLMHLPTDTASGLQLAVGTVPAGTYGGARVFVSNATIWFNTAITSDSGVTFQPNVGYPVTIPSGPESGIDTRAGFTIAQGASDVVLVFDVASAIRHAEVTRDGKILIMPVMDGHGHPH
jgi:hypothetical protein